MAAAAVTSQFRQNRNDVDGKMDRRVFFESLNTDRNFESHAARRHRQLYCPVVQTDNRGRHHLCHCGVCESELCLPREIDQPVVSSAGVRSAVDQTRVWFDPMTDEDISWYVASGEPVDRAGAYAIQGLASRFIPRIEGSYSNVVGLPVALVFSILMAERPRLSPEL